ncbi:Vacuolar ATP synthase subunit C [Savitreella phatthalungensis]
MSLPVLIAVPPSSGESTGDRAYDSLRGLVSGTSGGNGLGGATRFRIPVDQLKVGTLDGLMQSAEELGKLDTQAEGWVYKISEVLKGVVQGDAGKLAEQQRIDGSKTPHTYIAEFTWSSIKYRADRPLAQLMETMSREGATLESDVRAKYAQYNATRSQLQAYTRRAQGNLSTRHLGEVVRREHVVQGSEYLETRFFAVPAQRTKEWENGYESLSKMVVPRSSTKISADSEYALYSVVLFKKFASEFADRARDRKFIPRDFTYDAEEARKARQQYETAQQDEKRQWGEVLRLCSASFSDAFVLWIHVKALRTFVEAVLRYGLPPNFAAAVITPAKGKDKQLSKALAQKYEYLADRTFQAAGMESSKQKKKVQGGQEGLEESVNAVESGFGLDGDYVPYVAFPINWPVA